MNLNEFLDAYVPCRDKIESLISDKVVRENILAFLIDSSLVPFELVDEILNFEFFDQYDSEFARLVVLYSFVSNLFLSEFWHISSLSLDMEKEIYSNCVALLDMVEDRIVKAVMAASGFRRVRNEQQACVWTRI